ncbi:hypothetical protein [Nocardioides sp. GY 10127]|uniref:hypothetical protein n=1 Tax=Nocardioides sp. GY 10127 TaxID=2569762 RepID=UPI0010A8BA73|nr:hypothetical protein [Nocardioides sp. GY 10127]TIC82836.1 hypothetical protein E8D37_09215 [Nocardioides sp. GY 10127]
MTRTLRGAWSRRSTLLPLLALTVVVVAGVVAVLGLAGAAGTSRALALPLLVLGAVALPTTGAELARARRGEIALARLRGLEGAPLLVLLAAEPLLVLALGGLVGAGAGLGVAAAATRAWVGLPATAVASSGVLAGSLVAAVGVLLAGLVAVAVGMVAALREPLTDQVGGRPRRRAAGLAALFGQVLVVVAAVVACYRASLLDTADPGADVHPDLLVLAGSALVGLAVGGLALALGRLSASLLVRRGTADLASFVAVRRVARTADAAAAVRVLIAAAVVAGLALTAADEVDAWADDTSRLEAGGPVSIAPTDPSATDLTAAGLLSLTQRLDDSGRYLMAAVVVPGAGSALERRVYWDASRAQAVLGDFYASTPAAGVEAASGSGLPMLSPASVFAGVSDTAAVASGTFLNVTVGGVGARSRGRLLPSVRVTLRSGTGRRVVRTFDLTDPSRTGRALTGTAMVPCGPGCSLEQVVLANRSGAAHLPWLLRSVGLGGIELLDQPFGAAATSVDFERGGILRRPGHTGDEAADGTVPATPVVTADGLLVPAGSGVLVAEPTLSLPVPVLATDSVLAEAAEAAADDSTDAGTDEGTELTAESPGGDDLAATVVGTASALPLVGADGVLLDLPTSLVGASPTVPAAELRVLAAADTPPRLLAKVERALGGRARTLAQVREDVVVATGAMQARVFLLLAGFCLAAALLVLATAVARERRAWVHDVAALRSAGVPLGVLRGSAVREAAWLVVLAVGGAVLGTALGAWVLLPALRLVAVPEHGLALATSPASGPLALLAVVVAVVVALVVLVGRSVGAAGTRPGVLREEGR